MLRSILILTLLGIQAATAEPWFDGEPDYADSESESLANKLLAAHGGMQPMLAARSLQFEFFTKTSGGPMPFYSREAVDLATGDGYIEWPFWNSTIALYGDELWSHKWPMPLPAGFFIRLTTSFITLPWQVQADAANIGPASKGQLPGDDAVYDVLRVTFDRRNPSIPGTFYDIYIDTDSHLMKGLRFDISHPGMVANPEQPLGPNFHVFDEYRNIDGLVIPTFYKSYGTGKASDSDQRSNAYHFAWNIDTSKPFDREKLQAPAGAVPDSVSMQWWQQAGTQGVKNAGDGR
ncbi:MAG: hypothetical protein OEW64_01385 [Gammaproteobacteria bacterium]|nr:hypothetical protein [Gammaproteobacteria bacterium]MDH5302733.1 hypothetical protein [Gammaproteobacteria bacterium]MDH5321335.1 hypothetical protein [Gammaproteobacteria bacterium]